MQRIFVVFNSYKTIVELKQDKIKVSISCLNLQIHWTISVR